MTEEPRQAAPDRVGEVGANSSLWPLPDHPALAEVARALEGHGFAGEIRDAEWRPVYLSNRSRDSM